MALPLKDLPYLCSDSHFTQPFLVSSRTLNIHMYIDNAGFIHDLSLD